VTRQQLQQALEIAQSDVDLSAESQDSGIFNGYGWPSFEPVTVTIRQVAELIRWQAINFDGTVNARELNALASVGRRKFQVLG
jgi:hypothetical protein